MRRKGERDVEVMREHPVVPATAEGPHWGLYRTQLRAVLRKNWLFAVRAKGTLVQELGVPLLMLLALILLRNGVEERLVPTVYHQPLVNLDMASAGAVWSLAALSELHRRPRIGISPCEVSYVAKAKGVLQQSHRTTDLTYVCYSSTAAMLQDRRALFAGVAFDEQTVIGGSDGSGSSDGDVPFVIYMSGSLVPYPSSSHFQTAAGHSTVAERAWVASGFLSVQHAVQSAITTVRGAPTLQVSMTALPLPAFVELAGLEYVGFFLPLYLVSMHSTAVKAALGAVLDEKEQKLREGMLMVGLSTHVHMLSWFITLAARQMLLVISCAVLTRFRGIMEHTDLSLLFLYFGLFSANCVAYVFLVAAFFDSAKVGSVFGYMAFQLSAIPFALAGQLPPILTHLLCLVPPFGFALGAGELWRTESLVNPADRGLHWGTLFHATGEGTPTFGYILVAQLVAVVLLSFFAWYVAEVRGGGSGVGRFFSFCLQGRRRGGSRPGSGRTSPDCERATLLETKSPNGIRIRNLVKEFALPSGQVLRALDGLSLDLHAGEVTALLGHNGAGKTTTMSILNGLIAPSGGSAHVFEYSVQEDMARIRQLIGTCPQHDVLWPLLTAEEHLDLFAGLKGLVLSREEARAALTAVGLADRAEAPAGTLSGGQRRRLSLAIAFLGDPKVVLLDEPTAGMDQTGRRQMWDLIAARRSGRVILLTTHLMDEADILADRVAVIAHGALTAVGSPLSLKTRYGVGYHLHVALRGPEGDQTGLDMEREEQRSREGLHSMVTATIPDCTVATGGVKGQVEYLLPLTSLSAFPALFKALDLNKWSYGLTQTTLEEAYLNIETWGPGVHQGADIIDDNALRQWEALSVKSPAQPSILLQFTAVFRKRVRSIRQDRKSWLSLVLLPLVVLVFVLTIKSQSNPPYASPVTPAITLFDDHRLSAAFPLQLPFVLAAGYTLSALNRPPSHPFTATNSQRVQILASPNPLSSSTSAQGDWEGEKGSTLAGVVRGTALLLPAACGRGCFGALVLGDPETDKDARGEQAAMRAVLFYNSSLYPSPVLLLAWAGGLALPAGGAFLPSYCPFPLLVGERGAAIGGVEEAMVAELADVDISSSLTTFFALVMHTVVMERVSGLKHQQLLAGCQPLAYWAAHLAMDGLSFAVVVLGMTLVMLLWGVDVVRSAVTLPSYVLLMCLYGVALTALLYALASVFKSPGAAQYAVVIMMSVGSLFIRGIVSALQASLVVDDTTKQVAEALQYIDPNVALAKGLDILTTALQVSQAREASEEPSALFLPLSWENGVGESLVALVLSALLFLGWCACAEMQLTLLRPTPMPVTDAMGKEKEEVGEEDVDVAEERRRTQYAHQDELSIHHLRKMYGTKVALKDLCLRIAPCTSFCLLGSNGAGKTTLLSMLTGSLFPSAGVAMVGETILTGPSASLSRTAKVLSYCPQANPLHESLTVRQHLLLYAALGGLTEEQVAPVVDGYLHVLGLAGQADHLAIKLSGGNKRRLVLAIALVRDPRVLLLDEPTAGLDPWAQRQVVEVLRRWRTTGQRSILMTTHLMEVCRVLADRIGILVQGKLVCLGRVGHLQSKFGAYLQLDLVWPNTEPTDLLAYMRQQLVAEITLLGHHRGHYTLRILKDGISLADVFSALELARAAGRILEYGVQLGGVLREHLPGPPASCRIRIP